MKKNSKLFQVVILVSVFLTACNKKEQIIQVDYLISNGFVYNGENKPAEQIDVAICGNEICYVGLTNPLIKAKEIIDATGLIVTPGFIDPHTHSLEELDSAKNNGNINYLTQGVTSVFIGNDGAGTPYISKLKQKLEKNGIGTNVGMFVGHGEVRKIAMGLLNKPANEQQLIKMKELVNQAMIEGALGLSGGLYYVPGRYSNTREVIELAKVASNYSGIYDSHIRDESTFNIGFINAIKEVIEIAEKANIKAHIAHIKALGVDVWGQSQQAIELINKARTNGQVITADQYPWEASGTFLNSAVVPAWVMADSDEKFKERLVDEKLLVKIKMEITENIRRRGGGKSLLVTASKNSNWLGKTLKEIADNEKLSEVDTVINISLKEEVRVASFNMSSNDIEAFMQQPWVVSSSDGTNGHPRKYASFPQKYQKYVQKKNILSLSSFIHKSSGQTADIFSIEKRGYIKKGYFADLNLIKIENYKPMANFSNWNKISTGVKHQFVNGTMVINNGSYLGHLSGVIL